MPIDRYHELLDRIDAAEVARVCADLVRLNTVNPPGDERIAAEYVAEYLGSAGFEADFLPYPGDENRASVVCRLRGGRAVASEAVASVQEAAGERPAAGPLPALLFNGHLDVVPVGAQPWRYPPFDGVVDGDRVWGRGASDMKSGVAAMLVAARTLAPARQELRGDLIFAATAGEEHGMQGAFHVSEWPGLGPVGAIVISEPTGNTLGLAERGMLWIELTTHGKTAHSSTPYLGRNAVTMMRRLLDAVERLDFPFTRHPILGDFTYSINTIQGGSAANVIPDHCVASLDFRTVPGQDHAVILRQLETLIAEFTSRDPDFRGEVHSPLNLPSVDTPAGDPAVQNFSAAVEAVTGHRPEPQTVRFATEASVFVPQLQVPAIIFGPGEPAMAHQPDEYASIAAMASAARIYLAAALQMLA